MTTKTDHISNAEAETIALAEQFARTLEGGERIALIGDLGAGKTRFVRGLAIALGHDPARVASPTYVLSHEYSTPGARLTLVHVDAYRLNQDDEAESLALDELDESYVVVAEWAGRRAELLDSATHEVTIEHLSESSRRITITDLRAG